ncbi:VCBS repeat-containing protein [Schnuerera sp. xch1]|uniref:FG-GAP repeat domain-containing protein n=1 Tax=Schnuerera sp. xch1 TaxID=2874283 RepID=UPI001CC155FE|nr:VCBS repeat-containing protein [Schnuerera sp. xch1]MBZ2175122.1 VCBS repeat-containing protein [Schnuerera sp. xch1]
MKRFISVLTVLIFLISGISYAAPTQENQQVTTLIVYDKDTSSFLDIYQNYKQSLLTNLSTEPISLDNLDKMDLSEWNIIYLDKSVIGKGKFNNFKQEIMDFVRDGGFLFLEDEFYNQFPLEFLGAKSFKELEEFPKELKFPEVRKNLSGIQTALRLFHEDLVKYYDDNTLDNLNKGHGFIPSTSIPLAHSGDLVLYGLNQIGKGYVFYSNSMLPNDDYITGFDMTKKQEDQEYFSFTFATGNYLFRNEFPAFVSKELYGFAAKKVLGPYGRPAMAWQNHFEVSSAIENGTMEKWIEILKEYQQIPSFSLARSLYEWGTWKESIVLHTNIGTNEDPKFIGEEENSHYSSGRHLITENNEYVSLKQYEEYKSLGGKLKLPYRAYPSVGDLDGDNILDIVSGSQDGYLYLFLGKDEGIMYQDKVKLKDQTGNPINVGKYSTPVLYDINKNGTLNIIVGNSKGKIFLYLNQGNLTFKMNKVLLEDESLKNATPTIGDLDGDSTPDLVVGNAAGEIYFYRGKWIDNVLTFNKDGIALKNGKDKNINVGTYAAPTLCNIDGNKQNKLLVGNSTGYIKKYEIKFPNLIDNGYVEGNTYNQHGDKKLWGGYYSVPAFADLNGDGNTDLLVGQAEFGMPTPIDSPLFPYEKELKESIAYVNKNNIDIYPHVYFNKYKSSYQEEKELELQKKAFEYYSISWMNVGTNQHTWDVNNISNTQSFYNQMKAGIKWNLGFRASIKAGEPSLSRDYIWTIPFKLGCKWDTKDFILFSPSSHVPTFKEVYNSYTTLDLPITHFYHIEYAANEEDGLNNLRYKAQVLDYIRDREDYNFMTEPQMFDIFESVMNSNIEVIKNVDVDKFSFNISSDKDIAGIKFEVGEKFKGSKFAVDADIFLRDGEDIYVGLNRDVSIYLSQEEDSSHIVRVNGPVEIVHQEDVTLIELKGKGLQQIKLYAPKGLEVLNKDFAIENSGHYYTLTRYGEPTTAILSKVKLQGGLQ